MSENQQIESKRKSEIREERIVSLLESGDVDTVVSLFNNNALRVDEAISEYDTKRHAIFTDPRRQDRVKKNGNGERDIVRRAKLPISYQRYINEFSIVFMYGQPVSWVNASEEGVADNAYGAFLNTIKSTRFNARIREAKRLAGAETESALLFRVYRNGKGKADVQIRVLARSKGDKIYTSFDIYDNMTAFAWEYDTIDSDNETTKHCNIYLANDIYQCTQDRDGWKVIREKNLIGKIPVVYIEQSKEWDGVEEMIERKEYLHSRTADTNDYFSDPQLMISTDVVKSLPDKDQENKTLIVKSEDVSRAAQYLTWDNAPQSKKDEMEQLHKMILMMSFTPDVNFDNMKSLSAVSGKALKQMMMLADIKSSMHKERHDDYLSRVASILTAIIANVTDLNLRNECEKLSISHKFNDPFGEDITEMINNLVKSKDSGIISTAGAIERNPIVDNATLEKERIAEEESKRLENDVLKANSFN